MDASTRTPFLRIVTFPATSSPRLFVYTNLMRCPQPMPFSHSRDPLSCPKLMLPFTRSIPFSNLANFNCSSNYLEDCLVIDTAKPSSNLDSFVCRWNFIPRPRFFSCNSHVQFPIFSQPPISLNPSNLPFLEIGSSHSAFGSSVGGKYHVWHNEFDSKPVDCPFRLSVVLLGWLGAERKHLKRYTEWYASRGIQPITFIVPVKDLFGFDVGSMIEQRLAVLSSELMVWLMDKEKDGKERRLLVHTFSNTGWFSYGIILENLQLKGNLAEKIKGCVIDSGPEPELNPSVWASGFAAALIRKPTNVINNASSIKDKVDHNAVIFQETKTPITEVLLLVMLEKFFSVVLKFPAVKDKLDRIISTLSYQQPACPQLYLYSRADKVVPSHSIERFMDFQKRLGRTVTSHDFISSPHVDHLRTFPDVYSAQLQTFLHECVPPEKN